MTVGENSKIAIGVVITAVTLYVFNYVVGLGEAGVDANSERQIKSVIEEAMKLDDGRTLSQAMRGVEKEVNGVKVEVAGLKGEVKGMNDQLDILIP